MTVYIVSNVPYGLETCAGFFHCVYPTFWWPCPALRRWDVDCQTVHR